MKRAIALILVLAIAFALCACGQSKELTDAEKEKIYEEMQQKKQDKSDAQDNAEYQFEIEDFDAYMENGELEVKVKVRNLTDKDIDDPFFSYQILDENGDALTSKNQSLDTMLAGQAAWKEIPVSLFSKDIDISEMKGICFTKISYKDNYDQRFGGITKYDFSDYITADSENAVSCALNDTVETDSVKLTVSEFFYEDQIIGSITQLAKLNPDDGEIWACIGLTLENIGKDQFAPYDILRATIDYNDGYTYSTKDATSLILNSEMKAYYYRAGGIGMKLSPLTSEKYCLAISCSPKLREDTESPINIMFELPDGSGTRTFIFKVQ